MLIPFDKLVEHFKLNITGILHVGAHECEELDDYLKLGIKKEDIYWIEAMEDKVNLMKKQKNVKMYQALVDVEDEKNVIFHITNNGQSSSILELGSHEQHHPDVKIVEKKQLKTTRLDTFIKKYNIPIEKLNFLNIDIQGKELDALKSMSNHIKHVKYIYTEVNTEKVYKDCALLTEMDDYLKEKGFARVACSMWGNCGWGDAFYILT